MIKEAIKENLEKADVIPDNLYYYNAVNDAASIVKQEAGIKNQRVTKRWLNILKNMNNI